MKNGDLIIDDINHHEAEVLIENTNRISSAPASRRNMSSKKAAYRSNNCTVMTTAALTPDSAARLTFTGRSTGWFNSNVFRFIKAPWQKRPELAGSYAWNG